MCLLYEDVGAGTEHPHETGRYCVVLDRMHRSFFFGAPTLVTGLGVWDAS